MGKFNPKKKIFQADQKTLKEFPFYQGLFMSDEEFQKEVIATVYFYQTDDERCLDQTIYKNNVGFAKGIQTPKLHEVARKIIGNVPLTSSDRSTMRAYGKGYVPQYIDIIRNDAIGNGFEKFKEKYNEYDSLCQEVLDGIETVLNSSGVSMVTKTALMNEEKKLKGISTVKAVKSNLKKILGQNVYQTVFKDDEEGPVQMELF